MEIYAWWWFLRYQMETNKGSLMLRWNKGSLILKWSGYHEKCSQEPYPTPKAKNTAYCILILELLSRSSDDTSLADTLILMIFQHILVVPQFLIAQILFEHKFNETRHTHDRPKLAGVDKGLGGEFSCCFNHLFVKKQEEQEEKGAQRHFHNFLICKY